MNISNLPEYAPALRTLEDNKRGEKWAQRALEGEAALVAGAANGTRNTTLNNAALKLGHKVAAGLLRQATVEAALMEAAQQSGLMQEDGPEAVRATIASGLTAGMQEPDYPKDRDGYQPAPRGPVIIQPGAERKSRFYSAADLKGKPIKALDWAVDGMIPKKTVTLFSGDGGTGKSLLALQLSASVSAGAMWMGRRVATGPVIYMTAEDDNDELQRRINAISDASNIPLDAMKQLTLRSLAGEDALLAIDSQVALIQSELFNELEQRADAESPELIVIDTLADVYPANENDRAKVRQFIGILRGLALRQNCAVLLLGHPSLTGLNSGSGTSGSTAWNNSVRSRLYLSRITDNGFEADPDRRVMTTMKANYGRIGGETHMKWQNGVFVAEQAAQGLDAMAAGAKAQRVFMKLLKLYTAQGRQVNHAGGTRYAPKAFAEHPDNEGMTKRAFKGAMESLLASEKLVIKTTGPASRQTSYIAEAGQ
ncbi:AAA family ATPase [Loktanella salsilacus]|uniref:AAA family ATPase n=1 Tax=Loktanella salsilacus TaxID=195913 RepID=UPI003734D754